MLYNMVALLIIFGSGTDLIWFFFNQINRKLLYIVIIVDPGIDIIVVWKSTDTQYRYNGIIEIMKK